MASARAEQLIHLLLQRRRPVTVVDPQTGLPSGWSGWLAGLAPLPRPRHAHEVVQALLPRPPLQRTGVLPQLSLLQAMRRLLWQHWDPPPRDQRWMRWTAAACSLLLHLCFALLLLWVAVIRPPYVPAAGGAGDGERVQVAFVEGGGAQAGAGSAIAAEEAGASSAAATAAAATASTPPAPVAPQDAQAALPPAPQPQPEPQAQPDPQPLQATEVVEPTRDFVVPPVTRTEVAIVPRAPAAPPSVRERTVQVPQRPQPIAAMPVTEIPVQVRERAQLAVREREVAQPLPVVIAQAQVQPRQAEVQLPTRELQVHEREVQVRPEVPSTMVAVRPVQPSARPTPSRAPETVRERTVAAPAATQPSPTASPSPAPATTPSPAAQRPMPAASPARTAAADPGNWAQQARNDDWSSGSRSNPPSASAAGGTRGMFNADGSVRVPGAAGGDSATAERGAPGGEQDGWSRDRIAQAGTWLQRPPYDYTPTSLDKYWVPHETLLAEWVRRGIKSIDIPLPGTSTRIRCVVSLLQAGGGCGLSDPNMQEQPAVARPPPDIPFKKELQEDNGSVRD